MAAAGLSSTRSLLPLFVNLRHPYTSMLRDRWRLIQLDKVSSIPYNINEVRSIHKVILTTSKCSPSGARGDLRRLSPCLSTPPNLLAVTEDRPRDNAVDRQFRLLLRRRSLQAACSADLLQDFRDLGIGRGQREAFRRHVQERLVDCVSHVLDSRVDSGLRCVAAAGCCGL